MVEVWKQSPLSGHARFCRQMHLLLLSLTVVLLQENMKVREVIPHIDPIPIVIPLRLFLDYINFPRIMLPRALRGSFVEERKCSNMPAVRISMLRWMPNENTSSFHFYTNQSLSISRKRKLLEDSPVEKKRQENKFSSRGWRHLRT